MSGLERDNNAATMSMAVAAESITMGRRTGDKSVRRARTALVAGSGVLILLYLASLVLPLPYNPGTPDSTAVLQAPSGDHWFGTDLSGFDIFSRTIDAAKRDMPLAIAGALMSLVIGVAVGLIASAKGRAGERIMRILDGFQAFPILVISIALVTLSGNKLHNVIIAIAFVEVPRFVRLVRSEALTLRESRFIEAAIASGGSRSRIMFRHMLPNVAGITLVQMSLSAAHALIVIASLSFLGVGVSPPTASWGMMIQEGARQMATGQWWVVAFPGLAVFIAVAAFNSIADNLDRLLDRSAR